MRREGFIPTVVYGGGEEPQNLKVVTKTLTDLLRDSASSNIVVDLSVEGKSHLAFIQDVQTDPLTGAIIHADFLAIDRKTEITADIPIVLLGEPEGVKNGGVLDQQVHELEISCLPGDLPETIKVDVSALAIGDSLHVSEVDLPKGVTTQVDGEVLVAALQQPRVEAEPEETEEKSPDEVEATSQKGDKEEE